MGIVGGIIVALIVGGIGAIVAVRKKGKERTKLNMELTARGVAIQPGIGALSMPQTALMIGGTKPAAWSAHVPGQPALCLYQIGDGAIVVAWRSSVARPAVVVVAGQQGCVGNPAKKMLTETPKKQLPVKGLFLFASSPEAAQWMMSSPAITLLAQRFSTEPGWTFTYEQGACYVFSYQGHWHGFDDIANVATSLERALG